MWRLGVRELWAIAFVVGCGSGETAPTPGANPGTGGRSAGGTVVDAGAAPSSSGGAGASTGGSTVTTGGAGGTIVDGGHAGSGANAGDGAAREAGAGGASAGSGGVSGGSNSGGAGGARDGGSAGIPDSGSGGAPPLQTTKLDLLLVVDNSSSMVDKQEVLARAIPDLVRRITNPALGIKDLHVGVVTSSLGSHGASSTCASGEMNDKGHLLATLPRGASLNMPWGFAAWQSPASTDALASDVQKMVGVADENGCGLEATLEAMYRFLVDPKPSASIALSTCPTGTGVCAIPTGVDTELLSQRANFLRPESAVAIVLISDENDCSIIDGAQNYYAADLNILLPRAAAACAQNPNDPCCYSCGMKAPAGCAVDPTCQTKPSLDPQDDEANLRCFAQRRRFGVDFLYPVERYINALTRQTLCLSRTDLDATKPCPSFPGADAGNPLIPNPLFNTPPLEGLPRNPTMVYLLGIIGVPWQTIRVTKDSAGNPLPANSLVYPTNAALTAIWPTVLGDPAASPPVAPLDPLMIESILPRTGVTPGTGEALAPPSAGFMANSVNGHERSMLGLDDLQHACIFHLDVSHVCTDYNCDCFSLPAGENNPVCQASDGSYGSVQFFGRAYPGLRHLSLVKGMGQQAAVASICAKNLTDETRRDFGYRPAVDALMVELDRSIQ